MDMLAKVNFNKIAEETRQESVVRVVYVVWLVCTRTSFHFFACDGGGAVDLPQRVIFFFFSLQSQALFHVE